MNLPDFIASDSATLALIVRAKLVNDLANTSYDDAWDALLAEGKEYAPPKEVEDWMRQNWNGVAFGAAPADQPPELALAKIGVVEGEITPYYPPSRAQSRSWMPKFLEVFVSSGGSTTAAAQSVNISRRTPGKAAEVDEVFRMAWQEARDHLADIYRTVLHDRAVNGWQEPVYGSTGDYKDGLIGSITKYDNSLLKYRATVLCEEHRQHDKDKASSINVSASASAKSESKTVVSVEEMRERQGRQRKKLAHQVERARQRGLALAPTTGKNEEQL